MVIVENNEQLSSFLKIYRKQDSIVLPIQSDEHKHPADDDICLLYVQIIDGEEYILSYNHSESLNLDEQPNLNSDTKKYTIDKKRLQHLIDIDGVVDVNLLHYIQTNQPLETENIDTNSHNFFNMKHYRKKNINRVIPILKHLELCRKLSKILLDVIEKNKEDVNLSYNDDILNNLSYLEGNGIQTTEGMVYSEYNIFTSTGRPSNRFGGTNFAALNKKDGSRKPYVSRYKNGVLVEMDYDAYHLRLIGERIGYDFPKGSVHEHMAKFYGVDYEESKRLSFKYLYGFIPYEVSQLNPFFAKVENYIKKLWEEYNNKEFILSDIYSKRIYRKNLDDMNANKLFNYTIQLMETENNMKVLSELIPNIQDYKSKLILYSYDSFLLDFNMEDGLDYIKKVKEILEQKGKFPVKVSWGLNYHEMKDITEKFV
tara:strand:+ start:419 stop:1699 length:1281 start_codon:yes stop_codon:yes gene_type:complete